MVISGGELSSGHFENLTSIRINNVGSPESICFQVTFQVSLYPECEHTALAWEYSEALIVGIIIIVLACPHTLFQAI